MGGSGGVGAKQGGSGGTGEGSKISYGSIQTQQLVMNNLYVDLFSPKYCFSITAVALDK
jgi:hypothetical protein